MHHTAAQGPGARCSAGCMRRSKPSSGRPRKHARAKLGWLLLVLVSEREFSTSSGARDVGLARRSGALRAVQQLAVDGDAHSRPGGPPLQQQAASHAQCAPQILGSRLPGQHGRVLLEHLELPPRSSGAAAALRVSFGQQQPHAAQDGWQHGFRLAGPGGWRRGIRFGRGPGSAEQRAQGHNLIRGGQRGRHLRARAARTHAQDQRGSAAGARRARRGCHPARRLPRTGSAGIQQLQGVQRTHFMLCCVAAAHACLRSGGVGKRGSRRSCAWTGSSGGSS